jgi:putative membrane protein
MADVQDDPRTYFAAERTFLAWIRTGLALMGVGFALARFGLFLREMHSGSAPVHSTGASLYSGVALVALGVLVSLSAVAQHIYTVRLLQSGAWSPSISKSAVLLALLLSVAGVGMGIFLLWVR